MSSAYRVFISSTFEDLRPEREAAQSAIAGLDLLPDNMIYWSADDRSGTLLSLDRVRESDVVILVIAHRYGYVPDGGEFSVTELEYRAAIDSGIPVLAFFLDPTVAWPPDYVQFEQRERLDRFKALVESTSTRKLFRTPDDLGGAVTQALALLMRRRQDTTVEPPSELARVAVPVLDRAAILQQPDLLIHIGHHWDGLPVVLNIHRSQDLDGPFRQIAESLARPGSPPPTALITTFRQEVEEFARRTWAHDRLHSVDVGTDSVEMYVSRVNLWDMGQSLLSMLLAPRTQPGHPVARNRQAAPPLTARPSPSVPVAGRSEAAGAGLVSSGGSNRFLGIPLDGSRPHSVGVSAPYGWTSWHPFVEESLEPFDDYAFLVEGIATPVTALTTTLASAAIGQIRASGSSGASAVSLAAQVPRRSIVAVLVDLVRSVALLHEAGTVHGDLKPDNVIVGRTGPIAIDSFDLRVGTRAPGWTPTWSAPEQVLGESLTTRADLYPLAQMIAGALGGSLVGEVRKFRTAQRHGGRQEFDLFHDPFIDFDEGVFADSASRSAWSSLLRRCLRFDPDARPKSDDELADECGALLIDHPPLGSITLEDGGPLVVADLGDGVPRLAHLRYDWGQVGRRGVSFASPPSPVRWAPRTDAVTAVAAHPW